MLHFEENCSCYMLLNSSTSLPHLNFDLGKYISQWYCIGKGLQCSINKIFGSTCTCIDSLTLTAKFQFNCTHQSYRSFNHFYNLTSNDLWPNTWHYHQYAVEVLMSLPVSIWCAHLHHHVTPAIRFTHFCIVKQSLCYGYGECMYTH